MSGTTDAEFIELWNTHRSARALTDLLGISERNVHARRRAVEQRHNIRLESIGSRGLHYKHLHPVEHSARRSLDVKDGVVVVFSDAHFWPHVRTTAFKGLLRVLREMKPFAVINNGDCFDGASISRHPRIGWESTPSVIEELRACTERLSEVVDAAPNARRFWPLGNHDARFENRLAANAPEFQGVKGFTLKDHFPDWAPCWSVWINDDVVVKHRFKSGIHATHNNTVWAGKTIVTGHLHSLKVTPFDDYHGTRWGVDTGTLADPKGPQFLNYTEDAPLNWRSGFMVLTFKDGELLWPEIVRVHSHNKIDFRGHVIDVSGE
jgi:hypothetical protein